MSSHQPLARAVATFGGLGDRLPAPGTTVGSLPPALLWMGLCMAVPTNQLRIALTAVGLVLFAIVGIWSSEIEAERDGVRATLDRSSLTRLPVNG